MIFASPLARRIGALGFAFGLALGAPLAAQAAQRSGHADGTSEASHAYFAGDLSTALKLAQGEGEHWIGGLAAYRLRKYDEAQTAFDALAQERKAPADVRAAGAYWASRAAAAAGHDDKAAEELKLAAASPRTFYGMIAERKLGLDADRPAKASPRLPTPVLKPEGGFTVEKALVYAIVLKESRFQANAHGGQAVGLMQLTPATAAHYGHGLLTDPGVNLKLGQAYFGRLLDGAKGDVLRALAAFNTGSAKSTGVDNDSLLAMESRPGDSTRAYVRSVMTAYWTYQRIFGGGSPSLDAAAEGGGFKVASLN